MTTTWGIDRKDREPWFTTGRNPKADFPKSTWEQSVSRRPRELYVLMDKELLLGSEEANYLDPYLVYLKRELAKPGDLVTHIEVCGFQGTDSAQEVVISVLVDAPFDEVMRLWGSVGERIEEWLTNQSDPMRRAVREQFALEFRSNSDSL